MSNLEIKVTKKFRSNLLAARTPNEIFAKALRVTPIIGLREYKKEMPVNLGTARSDAKIEYNSPLQATITTDTITGKGFRYPIAVHEGTGKFRGSSRDYPSYGRVRAGTVLLGIGGIRPNKFAIRAARKAKPLIMDKFIEKLEQLDKK